MSVSIRATVADDAARIAALAAQLGYPAPPDEMRRRLERLSSSNDEVIAVACDGPEVAGVIQVGLVTSIESETYAEVRALIVDEPCRGAGFGARLSTTPSHGRVSADARASACAHA